MKQVFQREDERKEKKKMKKGAIASFVFIVLFLVSVVPSDIKVLSLTSRPPIMIEGNSEFVPANGVTGGSGAASDPYIIEGWDINASTADGICIWDTTAYFIIRNVLVYDGGSNYNGIWLSNVTNGQVLNVNTTWNSVGIAIDSFSLNNNVSWNNVTNNQDGIYVWSSNKTIIVDNEVAYNGNRTAFRGNGISLELSSNSTISGNVVAYSGDIGVYLVSSSSCNIVSGNSITINNRGIMLDESSNCNTVFGNTLTRASGREGSGISLDRGCSNNSVSGNNITANTGYGFDVSDSNSNSFSVNSITNTGGGVWLDLSSSKNIFSENNITNNSYGVSFDSSSNNSMSGNNITNSFSEGVWLYNSSSNDVFGNNISNNGGSGVSLYNASNNISYNNISSNGIYGIYMYGPNQTICNNLISDNVLAGLLLDSSGNIISGNTISTNQYGIELPTGGPVSNNTVFHNNFLSNANQVFIMAPWYDNTWDNGYPSGGNYWSNYTGVDLCKGPYQNITGSDGIGDTPYIIALSNPDKYPLMTAWIEVRDVAITNVTTCKDEANKPFPIVGRYCQMHINVTVMNQGTDAETFNVTIYARGTASIAINQTQLALPSATSVVIQFQWNATLPYRLYGISAVADNVPGETDTGDNTFFGYVVLVTIPGDVTGDLNVQPGDLAKLIAAYGSPLGIRPYNPNCDLNDDHQIGPGDLALLIAHYGQHYP